MLRDKVKLEDERVFCPVEVEPTEECEGCRRVSECAGGQAEQSAG